MIVSGAMMMKMIAALERFKINFEYVTEQEAKSKNFLWDVNLVLSARNCSKAQVQVHNIMTYRKYMQEYITVY